MRLCGIFSAISVLLTTKNSDDLEIRVPDGSRSLKVTPIPHVSFHISHELYPRPYLVPFVRYSLRQVQNRCILLPFLRLTPLMEGFPWDDLRKSLQGGQRMAKVHSGEEILRE